MNGDIGAWRQLFTKVYRMIAATCIPSQQKPWKPLPPGTWLTRDDMLHLALKYAAINQVSGDYLEFGVFRGNTFRSAWKYGQHFLPKIHYYLFDSFQGLPAPSGIDGEDVFAAGQYCCNIEEFRNICDRYNIRRKQYTCIEGFYANSLTASLRDRLHLKKAAVIYIDCDYYESTIQALNWVKPYLQTGTIICFDDYFCYKAAPNRGEQLAIHEFTDRHSDIKFTDYHLFGWHGKSFITYKTME